MSLRELSLPNSLLTAEADLARSSLRSAFRTLLRQDQCRLAGARAKLFYLECLQVLDCFFPPGKLHLHN